ERRILVDGAGAGAVPDLDEDAVCIWLAFGQRGETDAEHHHLVLVERARAAGLRILEVEAARDAPGSVDRLGRAREEGLRQPRERIRPAGLFRERGAQRQALKGRGGHALAVDRVELRHRVAERDEAAREVAELVEAPPRARRSLEPHHLSEWLALACGVVHG